MISLQLSFKTYKSLFKSISSYKKNNIILSAQSTRLHATNIDIDDNITTDQPTSLIDTNTNTIPLKSTKIKVRQHVNPLSLTYQKPIDLPTTWLQPTPLGIAFANPNQPLYLDIGCAKGTWLLNMARENPDCNFLGLEIRKPCVQLAMERKQQHNLTNLHYLASNINVDITRILTDINNISTAASANSNSNTTTTTPTITTTTSTSNSNNNNTSNILKLITIQFPDPHFKKAHKKRKAVTTDLVTNIYNLTKYNTNILIYIQSDIEEVTIDMMETFLNYTKGGHNSDLDSNCFIPGQNYDPFDLINNKPYCSVKTEREIATEVRIY